MIDQRKETEPMRFRTIFISDFHLGTKRAHSDLLLDFLERTESETLYLVGDIIDIWALKKNWHWNQIHNAVIKKIMRKARKGTRVIYIPGNHDEQFRDFCGHKFGYLTVRRDHMHTAADGKKYLVMHGDEFDGVVLHVRWLAVLGSRAYEIAMALNSFTNKIRTLFGRPYWSLSAYLKYKVKRAVEFLSRFEELMVAEARKKGADGVICGHVHTPEIRDMDGITYLNDGDWVESCSALVEHADGTMEILHWRKLASPDEANGQPTASETADTSPVSAS